MSPYSITGTTLSPMEPNVSNNCGIGEQRSAGLRDKCPSAAHRRNLLGARVKQVSLIMDMRSGESSKGGLHRESGYRRSQEREFCALQNRNTRFPDQWGTTVNRGGQVVGFHDGERTVDRSMAMSHQGLGNRESGGRVLVDIANRETPMESMVKDMW